MAGRAGPDWIGLYLEEDLGEAGDITSGALFGPGVGGRAAVVAREPAFTVGLDHAAEVFRRLGAVAAPVRAGDFWAGAGERVLWVEGPAVAILAGERLALNIVARMSGIATAVRAMVDGNPGLGDGCRVAGTRKTTPGFRFFEKEAIRRGGGDPHRGGLFDEAMVKDNHVAACGGDVASAVRRVKAACAGRVVSCEVESLEAALAAAGAGADWLLIDNQPPATGQAWAARVRDGFPGIRVEASGGITPERVAAYAWADRVSLGWLTQKVPAKDFSLEWDEKHE